MQVSKTFPGWDAARWSRPWFAKVGTWPDSGPAVMTFGKTVKGAIPPGCTVEADPGDVVRWGMKDLATGQADPAQSGWGMVRPDGSILLCTVDEARVYRRRAHPEDANAAAIRPAGFSKGKGKGRPRAQAQAPGPAPGPAAGAPPIPTLLEAARAVSAAWLAWTPGRLPDQGATGWKELVDAILNLEAVAGIASPAAPAVQSPKPYVPLDEEQPKEAEADETPAPVAPAPLGMDENGLPLF